MAVSLDGGISCGLGGCGIWKWEGSTSLVCWTRKEVLVLATDFPCSGSFTFHIYVCVLTSACPEFISLPSSTQIPLGSFFSPSICCLGGRPVPGPGYTRDPADRAFLSPPWFVGIGQWNRTAWESEQRTHREDDWCPMQAVQM